MANAEGQGIGRFLDVEHRVGKTEQCDILRTFATRRELELLAAEVHLLLITEFGLPFTRAQQQVLFSLAAATIFIARVICWMFLTPPMRAFISL